MTSATEEPESPLWAKAGEDITLASAIKLVPK
jgi:hypothetical protein